MTVICAWCGKVLRITTDHSDLVSHGICDKCSVKVTRDWRGKKAGAA